MGLPRAALRGGVVLGSAIFACACSLLLDTNRVQCATDGDCAARGGPFASASCVASVCVVTTPDASSADAAPDAADPTWGCIGNPAAKPSRPAVDYTLTLTDVISDAPVRGARVRECPSPRDLTCSNPLATFVTNSNGLIELTLDTSKAAFNGYFAIDPMTDDGGAPDARAADSYLPSRVYYESIPITADYSDSYPLLTNATLQSFTTAYQLGQADLKTSFAFLFATDCLGRNAAGVTFSSDMMGPTTRVFYVQNGEPSTTAVSTDTSGLVIFLNVPVGSRTFTSQVAATKLQTGIFTGYALAGTVSYAGVGPPVPSL